MNAHQLLSPYVREICDDVRLVDDMSLQGSWPMLLSSEIVVLFLQVKRATSEEIKSGQPWPGSIVFDPKDRDISIELLSWYECAVFLTRRD